MTHHGITPEDLRPPRHLPRGWKTHTFTRSWTVDAPREQLWGWLNDRRTFERQLWPWRVEFIDGSGVDGGSGFSPGVLNAHHGPFLNFSGILTEIDPGPDGRGRYRDLQYFYGAFFLGLRFVRPTRLQFWVSDHPNQPDATTLRVQIDAHVRPAMTGLWTLGQQLFWPAFPRSAARGSRRRAARQPGRGSSPSSPAASDATADRSGTGPSV